MAILITRCNALPLLTTFTSILPNLSQTYERIMYNQICHYFDTVS